MTELWSLSNIIIRIVLCIFICNFMNESTNVVIRISESKFPCRLCRMKKCISAGMQPSSEFSDQMKSQKQFILTIEVQGPRDNNSVGQLAIAGSGTFRHVERIEYDIKWKTMDRLFNVVKSREQLELNREITFDKRNIRSDISLYDMTVDYQTDAKMLYKFCETAFPEFKKLPGRDKEILFNNFREKWLTIETALSNIKNNDLFTLYSQSGGYVTSMERFYLDSAKPNSALNEGNVRNLQNVETMAILSMCLWDAGYVNVNDNLANICHAMRKIICRELSAYYEEKESPQNRFFETLDVLNLIERADKKCLEEYQLCEMFDLNMDMRALDISSWQKL
uniref:NR LBD domain-containing protein n=1 Tax=Caenorhabditis tropicalis TaxID=1561998 RepID=A0A1I7T9L4_9PELO